VRSPAPERGEKQDLSREERKFNPSRAGLGTLREDGKGQRTARAKGILEDGRLKRKHKKKPNLPQQWEGGSFKVSYIPKA